MIRLSSADRDWRRDPWQHLARLQAEMDRWLPLANDSYAPATPPVDVWAGEDEVLVEAALPGVEPDDVDISVEADVLTLRARRKAPEASEGERVYRRERGFGEFSRRFKLPFRVESSAVDARFANGVLEVRLPRAAVDRPRRIAVHAS